MARTTKNELLDYLLDRKQQCTDGTTELVTRLLHSVGTHFSEGASNMAWRYGKLHGEGTAYRGIRAHDTVTERDLENLFKTKVYDPIKEDMSSFVAGGIRRVSVVPAFIKASAEKQKVKDASNKKAKRGTSKRKRKSPNTREHTKRSRRSAERRKRTRKTKNRSRRSGSRFSDQSESDQSTESDQSDQSTESDQSDQSVHSRRHRRGGGSTSSARSSVSGRKRRLQCDDDNHSGQTPAKRSKFADPPQVDEELEAAELFVDGWLSNPNVVEIRQRHVQILMVSEMNRVKIPATKPNAALVFDAFDSMFWLSPKPNILNKPGESSIFCFVGDYKRCLTPKKQRVSGAGQYIRTDGKVKANLEKLSLLLESRLRIREAVDEVLTAKNYAKGHSMVRKYVAPGQGKHKRNKRGEGKTAQRGKVEKGVGGVAFVDLTSDQEEKSEAEIVKREPLQKESREVFEHELPEKRVPALFAESQNSSDVKEDAVQGAASGVSQESSVCDCDANALVQVVEQYKLGNIKCCVMKERIAKIIYP